MNDIELVASVKVEFNWDAQEVAAFKRLEGTSAEGNQVVVNAIVSRNLLVTKMAAMSRQGYRMDHRAMKSLLLEISEMDVVLAAHGEV